MDLTEDEEGLSQEGAHRRNVEGPQEEGLQPEQRGDSAGEGNQAGENMAGVFSSGLGLLGRNCPACGPEGF